VLRQNHLIGQKLGRAQAERDVVGDMPMDEQKSRAKLVVPD